MAAKSCEHVWKIGPASLLEGFLRMMQSQALLFFGYLRGFFAAGPAA